jgi:hypothetical protein
VGNADGDSLVASYTSKKALKACWEEDLKDFLEEHYIDFDNCIRYIMEEDASGFQQEMTFYEIFDKKKRPTVAWGASISEVRATVCHRAYELRKDSGMSRNVAMRQAWSEVKGTAIRREAERNNPNQLKLIA